MNDLSSSGLNLRTLTPKEYGELINDLNHNFMQILKLPGFKGQPGESIQGPPGTGIRGSKWVFVTITDLSQSYNVTTASQVTLSWINTIFNDDAELFYSTIYIPSDTELILGDILVLPSGQLIELAEVDDGQGSVTVEFVDTGISFSQVASITEEQVIQIFNNLFSQQPSSDGSFRFFNAVAKNNTDASPALNQNQNNDSVIDIVVPNSGPGAALPNRRFVAASEADISTTIAMCMVVGSATRYHELVQATQDIHTNNYAPGIDDFAAQVVLQNSYKNGIIFGHRNAESIRQFGRLYRSTNATVLTSSYSPLTTEYSELKLLDSQAIIRSILTTLDCTTLDILATTLNSKFFSYAGDTAHLADTPGGKLRIWAQSGVFLEYIQNANVLGTDATGKIIAAYSVETSMPNSPTNSQLLTALAIYNLFEAVNTVLDDHEDRITALEEADVSDYFSKQDFISSSVNMNTLTTYGTYIINVQLNQITNFAPISIQGPVSPITVNIYTVTNDDTGVERLLQTVTFSVPSNESTSPILSRHLQFQRFAQRTGSAQFTWQPWTKVITHGDEPLVISPILKSGDFATGLTISHKTTNAPSTNNPSSTSKFVKNIQLDGWGHIIGIESVDVAINQDDIIYSHGVVRVNNPTDSDNHPNRYLASIASNRSINYAYIYPPVGHTISDLLGFIPSLAYVNFEGDVDNNDFLWCQYYKDIANNRIVVIAGNSEQLASSGSYPERVGARVNYLGIWSKHPSHISDDRGARAGSSSGPVIQN